MLSFELRTPEDCLRAFGELASTREIGTIRLIDQGDLALMWKAAVVHPLEALNNGYLREVREQSRRAVDDESRQKAEFETLGRFFEFGVGEPRHLDGALNLGSAVRRLRAIRKELDALRETVTSDRDDAVWRALNELKDRLRKLLVEFAGGDEKVRSILPLAEIDQRLWLGSPPKLLEVAHAQLVGAAARLERVGRGLACVQMLHVIEPFYLFRLLLRYRIESDSQISNAQRVEASSALTAFLHNDRENMEWLGRWLLEKLADLQGEIEANGLGEDVLFYLKGGRALKALMAGDPMAGDNDWDTQIVINPNLSSREWYARFSKVHEIVLDKLQQFKRELFMEFHEHFEELRSSVETVRRTAERRELLVGAELTEFSLVEVPETDDAWADGADGSMASLPRFRATCKAELIDVGIPRRDTVESFAQWNQLKGKLKTLQNGVAYPGGLYYVDEYVGMLREAFAGRSPSLHKTPKRMARLADVLRLDETWAEIRMEVEADPALKALVQAGAGRISIDNQIAGRLLAAMLVQFYRAYGLGREPELAEQLQEYVRTAEIPRWRSKRELSALVELVNREPAWSNELELPMDCLAFASELAQTMKSYGESRAAFFREKRAQFISAFRRIHEGLFPTTEDWEVALAISGSYAAALQAEYARFDRGADLEPVLELEMELYCRREAERELVLDLLWPNLKEIRFKDGNRELKPLLERSDGSVAVYWPEPVSFGQFAHRPLIMRISVVPRDSNDFPQLAFVWGLPLVGLKDLVASYRRRAAEAEEYARRRELVTAGESLVDLLTRFENVGS